MASRLELTCAEADMTKFLTGTLGVIAVGVLLIAYGLLSPRALAFESASGAGRPATA
jgi:hypothetical protein